MEQSPKSTNEDCILAIDAGTQSIRALLFSLKGECLAKSQIFIESYYSKHPGWAEQDPEYFWRALQQACLALWTKSSTPKTAIKGITLTSQRGTVINLDEMGKPLRPAMLWLDQRRSERIPSLKTPWQVLFKLIGMHDTIQFFQREAESNWIKTHQPDVWDKTRHFLLLSGYLTYRLTGDFVDSKACQVGYIPFDYKKHRWAGKFDWKWDATSVQRDMLPKLIRPGRLLGEISNEAAKLTGIPAGLPLVAAAADKACETLGTGCVSPETACLSYGTTATINVNSKKYIEPVTFLPPYPSAIAKHFNMEIQIYRGYWMVNWFKQQFGHPEQQQAEKMGIPVETLFDNLVNQVPAGSMGLILQPYWSPGIRKPGPEAKGAIIGFGDVHTRAHVYRAILEGIAYALREGKEQIERKTKVPITNLHISGGGSQSAAAMQLTADIFGLPATRPHTYETSGLGAAITASAGLKLHKNVQTAVTNMTHIRDTFEPIAQNQALYAQLYERVYKHMYKQLERLYKEIRSITNYPKFGG